MNFKKCIISALIILAFLIADAKAAQPQEVCTIRVCNKLSRISFSVVKLIKDEIGETCFDVVTTKENAVPGKVLDSQSRWWQGRSFNPTKRSVTRVTKVYGCQAIPR